MARQRTFSSYNPWRGRDQNPDRTKIVIQQLGVISATTTKLVFRAPGPCKITRVTLQADSAVAGLNQAYWSFQLFNKTKGDLQLFVNEPTTQDVGTNAKGDIAADTVYDLGVDDNVYLALNDVLSFRMTKVLGAPTITNLALSLSYEIEDGPVPGSTDTTTSTSTSTSTTSTTSTSSSTTTTSSSTTTTSSSTTTTSSSTTTTSSSTTTTTTTTTTISTSTTTT